MSNNALTLFNEASVPAHIAQVFATESNIQSRASTPQLSYKGKVWQTVINGESVKLTRKDAEGDSVPLSVMRVVVLDYAKRRGRAYYEGAYNPDDIGSPVCWSDDGVAPDPHVANPQASKCDGCPKSIKGSNVTDNGRSVAACSSHRLLAVVPTSQLYFTPLRLKLAVTSDYDKQSPDQEAQGWFAFQQLTDFLRSRGATHTAALSIKMKFDSDAEYPKVLFAADRWLTPEEVDITVPLSKSEEIAKLISGTRTPSPTAEPKALASMPEAAVGSDDDDSDRAEAAIAAAKAEAAKVAAKAEAAKVAKAAAKAEAEAAAKAEAAKVAARAKAAAEDDDDDVIELPGTAVKDVTPLTKAAAKSTPEASADIPDTVKSLLADWGE
jgi:hypothetical protein